MKVIAQYTYTNKHAGPKAKVDVEYILKKYFSADIKPFRCKKDADTKLEKVIYRARKAVYMLKNRYSKTDILVIQAPFSKKTSVNFPADRRIALVHDIDGLRNGNKSIEDAEISILNSCDVVITHNKYMTDYLKKNGLTAKTVELKLFDYICEGEAIKHCGGFNTPTIVYAGNLTKSEFIHSLDVKKINYKFNLYGVGTSLDINEKMHYKGAFSPNELPDKLEGNLGLVWDGAADESDADKGFKNYTRFNNPHKLSCYIAAGLPVIVWSKSAAADFVLENNIGYTVSNLYEINDLDFSDYNEKSQNVHEMSKKVRSGVFTKNAMDSALELL